jgi:TonB family protein
MKPACIIILLITVPFIAQFNGCGSSSSLDRQGSVTTNHKDTVQEAYRQRTDSLFKVGYGYFDEKKYELALSVFNDLIAADTELSEYEAYAFAADCYSMLGQPETGLTLYDSLVSRMNARLKTHPDSYDLLLSLHESKYMKTLYPSLPFFLQKENGFVPYDSLPRPLQTRAPLYPESARRKGLEGTVWVKLRLSGTGKIEKVTILKSPNEAFTEEVYKVIPYWTFTPYRRKGRLSDVEVSIPFTFKINH